MNERESIIAEVEGRLMALGIPFTRYDHEAVATFDEAASHYNGIAATHTKNLFLRNDKKTAHYLVILEGAKRADLKSLARRLGESRLSFASPEALKEYLGVTPGSVSPFTLIRDSARSVRVVLDADLLATERLSFHPNVNTATLVISSADFIIFLESAGNTRTEIAL